MQTEIEIGENQRRWSVEHADALKFLQSQNSSSAGLVITDPAYDSLENHRQIGTTTRLTGDWFSVVGDDYYRPLFLEIHRVLRPDAHGYCFCDQSTLPLIRDAVRFSALDWFKFLIWDKVHIGMGYRYRARHELIAFFGRGTGRQVADLGVGDVLECPRVHGGYPTEKPVDLLRLLITQSSDPGDLVVDPFTGSGSTGSAALLEGRRFAGCDLDEDAVALAKDRLRTTK